MARNDGNAMVNFRFRQGLQVLREIAQEEEKTEAKANSAVTKANAKVKLQDSLLGHKRSNKSAVKSTAKLMRSLQQNGGDMLDEKAESVGLGGLH